MGVQQPELERASWAVSGPVKHGYPPPPLEAGSVTTAYCGEQMIVEGEYTQEPPRDSCPLCALVWEKRRRYRPW